MITYRETVSDGRTLRLFHLSTPHTSYMCGFIGDDLLVNLYYGPKMRDMPSFVPEKKLPIMGSSMAARMPEQFWLPDAMPLEFSTYGCADMRLPTVHLRYADGVSMARFSYKSHEIVAGKPRPTGLPATYTEDDSEAETLVITLRDGLHGAEATLYYTVFAAHDAVARRLTVTNTASAPLTVERAMSAMIDFPCAAENYDFIHLDGAWASERSLVRRPLDCLEQTIHSRKGLSGPEHNPFFALAERHADELHGRVYGFNLIYSGNFTAGCETNVSGTVRAFIGVDDLDFSYTLGAGESFETPEAVIVFSDEGLSGMSRVFHRLYRTRLCRGAWRDRERYALLNNWEGTLFDFNEEKILAIAAKGKEIGLDLMVLDDGWFKGRNNDKAGLGDWVADETKLPHGVKGLAERVKALGMKFGLWFEPEMVNPDSDLYRAHPDWVMHVSGMEASLRRNQLVLDLANPAVCDYIIRAVSDVLQNAPVSYVKWDCNRGFSEMGSDKLAPEERGGYCHRYMLGLYRILETLTSRFPDVLWEGCASGGGRFDGGILYYMPQIWTSDCTDAVERFRIQYGTSVVYPVSAMGAHVSAVPNKQTGRIVSMKSRGDAALAGQFGFELDASVMTEAEIGEAKACLARYRKYGGIIHKADLYRLRSPFETDDAVLEFLSEDRETVILLYEHQYCEMAGKGKRILLAALDPEAAYEVVEADTEQFKGLVYGGDELMQNGLFFRGGRDALTELRVFRKRKPLR